MLMRFEDPFREFDRLFQRVWDGGPRVGAAVPMDAYRHGDEVTVRFDLPGVEPDSIELTVERDVLSLTAERHWQPDEGDQVIVAERPQGRFRRQLFLGEGLDTDRIEASYEHGVLTLTVPVAEQAKPRKVEITSGGKARAIEASSAA